MNLNLNVSTNAYTWLSAAQIGVMTWALLSVPNYDPSVKTSVDASTAATKANTEELKAVKDKLGHKPGSVGSTAP